jgi:RHS repeat-associated protein
MANANPFRFSTKYQDNETDLLYYGSRYYTAITARWLSRDPVGERGGRNLMAVTRNDFQNGIDLFGLCEPGSISKAHCEVTIAPDGASPDLRDVAAQMKGNR